MRTFLHAILVILAGCGVSADRERLVEEFGATIPICSGEAECKAMWDAAQLWVVRNAAYRLDISTDVVIETYPPAAYSTDLAARVTKEPLGNDQYQIVVVLYCANIFGCRPEPWQKAIEFNNAVGSVR